MARYLIGIGNWNMTDDAVGLLIAERFAQEGCPEGYEPVGIHQDGMQLLFYCEPTTEEILVVDAVTLGKPPGEWMLFSPEDVETHKELAGISSHEGDVLRVLALGRELGYSIPPLRIFGIQPESMEWGDALSPSLAERFEEYLEALRREMALPGSTFE